MKTMKKVLAALAALALGGCMTFPVTIAPSSTPLTPGTYTVLGKAEGSAFGISILGLIPVSGFRQAGEARDDALRTSGGDAIIDIAADMQVLHLLVVTLYWTSLDGQAVKLEPR